MAVSHLCWGTALRLHQHLHNSGPPEAGIAATAVPLGRDILSPLGQGCPPFPGKEISLIFNPNPNPQCRLLPLSCHPLLLRSWSKVLNALLRE